MSDRLDGLGENALLADLAAIRSDIDDLRVRQQQLSGISGLLSYYSATSATWDANATVGSDSDTATRTTTFSVFFTHDASQSAPIARISFLLYVNGTDSAHQLTPLQPSWTDGVRTASVAYLGRQVAAGIWQLNFVLTTLKAITYYVKGAAYASCPGTVSVGAS